MRPVQPELHRDTGEERTHYGNPSSALPISGLSKRGQALIGRQRVSITIGPRNDPAKTSKLTKASI